MPARIIIRIDRRPDEEYWIDEEVFRIGSAEGSSLRIDHGRIAPRAATIEFRNGGYLVHNRSDAPLALDSGLIAPGGVSRWKAGGVLSLDDAVDLTLEVEGDPSPSPRPGVEIDDDDDDALPPLAEDGAPDAAASPASASAATSSQLIQVGVILASLAALVLLLLYDPNAEKEGEGRAPAFDEIVRELSEEAGQDHVLADIRSLLQEAHVADQREQSELSRRLYLRARDLLELRGGVRRPRGGAAADDPENGPSLDDRLWRYIRPHL